MSNIWWCGPSARKDGGTIPAWRARGYKIAVWRDSGQAIDADICITGEYPGHAVSTNVTCQAALALDPDLTWVANSGDDTLPDPDHTAQKIGDECTSHFGGTFGVMQPIGDGWGIETICGSPWMGREFCRRIYSGRGPLWPHFFHMFDDEHLQGVALKLGILWQRRDLIHKHDHWMRTGQPAPAFLERANSRKNWDEMKAIFERLRAGGFAEAENLLPAEVRA